MVSSLRLFFLAVATFLGGLLITFVSPLKLFSPTEKLSYQLAAGIAGAWADFMRWLLTTVKTENVITGDKPDPNCTYLILANHQSWIDIMMVMVVLMIQKIGMTIMMVLMMNKIIVQKVSLIGILGMKVQILITMVALMIQKIGMMMQMVY